MTTKQMFLLLILSITAYGCTTPPVNNSFPLSTEQAKADLKRMKQNPVSFKRPVLILAGFADPGLGSLILSDTIKKISTADNVISASFPVWLDMSQCRKLAIDTVEKHYPCDDPEFTTEVDVIGMSMGGIVARYAASAMPDHDGQPVKRLRIHRLFTISSPHRGANLADLPPVNSQQIDLRKGSQFLERLNTPGADCSGPDGYAIFAYTRLEDGIVGAENTAPPGQGVWWVHRPFLELGHVGSMLDVRIIADISRRLRDEQPWTRQPPAELPE